jgi:hypothetical protein
MSAAVLTQTERAAQQKDERKEVPEPTVSNPQNPFATTASPESRTVGFGRLVKRLRSNLGGHEEMKANTVEPTQIVDEIFEPLKPARNELAQLVKMLEPMSQVCRLAEAFVPVKAFQEKVASVVEPLRNLEHEFDQFAGAFEPMRILRDQVREISAAFAANVAEFAQILEPLNKLRRQLDEAVQALEPAGAMYRGFSELSNAIGSSEGELAMNGNAATPNQGNLGLLRVSAERSSN